MCKMKENKWKYWNLNKYEEYLFLFFIVINFVKINWMNNYVRIGINFDEEKYSFRRYI